MLEDYVRPHARLNALSFYGLIGLAASTVIHFGSYAGAILPAEHPLFWGLHIGIFPLFFMFVWRLRVWHVEREGLLGSRRGQLLWEELLVYFPRWMPALVILLFGYVVVNFFVATSYLPSGATVTAGAPPAGEQALYTIRAFSGHWLVFYALPALYFLFVPKSARPQEAVDERQHAS